MTLHVSVRDANGRLPELVAAAARGEDVVLDSDDAPSMRLVVADPHADVIARRAEKRRSAIGMFRDLVGDRDIDVAAIKAEACWDERGRRKFGVVD